MYNKALNEDLKHYIKSRLPDGVSFSKLTYNTIGSCFHFKILDDGEGSNGTYGFGNDFVLLMNDVADQYGELKKK